MARLARTVVPGLPHHVTQRGNRREAIFFEDGDEEVYRGLLAERASQGQSRGVGLLSHAQSCSPHSHTDGHFSDLT
jgi:REP element-mobilizing transposase RayT